MNWNEFVNEWLPKHCPIHPYSGVKYVNLWRESNNGKILRLDWISTTSYGYQLNAHNLETDPVPENILGICDLPNHQP